MFIDVKSTNYLEKSWLELRFHDPAKTKIKTPEDLEYEMQDPPADAVDEKILDRITGSMMGMALGDALGAHVEFRPRQYLLDNPVVDLEGGGTWGLQKGQVRLLCYVRKSIPSTSFSYDFCNSLKHELMDEV